MLPLVLADLWDQRFQIALEALGSYSFAPKGFAAGGVPDCFHCGPIVHMWNGPI